MTVANRMPKASDIAMGHHKLRLCSAFQEHWRQAKESGQGGQHNGAKALHPGPQHCAVSILAIGHSLIDMVDQNQAVVNHHATQCNQPHY